ncbi:MULTISPECIES: hypothetical protein [Comamonas]|uniref:hypothetical protein n=1 Tax=Comamonas TaxID=283 RepID=UPI0025C11ACE|nr:MULTISPECIES: hypothetical protein [Comamonas]MDR3066415.1 hypothetical protein [Comamonas sp.]MEB5965417.1 hypothetical protein [Comamonas testosteroni]
MKSIFRFPGADPAPAPSRSQPRAGFAVPAPTVLLLGAPHALARSMAHGLLQARLDAGMTSPWQCMAPVPGDEWPADALVYVLGQDWRDADPEPAIAQQISRWRELLHARAQSYVMLYGRPSAQWQQLAASLKFTAPTADWDWISRQNPWSSSQRIRRKACEQCGDPECELALFESLKNDR